MSTRLVCPRCAQRYAGVVDPHCRVCHGLGLLAAAGEDRAAAARAVSMHLDLWNAPREEWRARRRALQRAGLVAKVAGSRGIADLPDDQAERSAIGRRAGALLVELGLRPKPPPRRKPDPAARLTRAEKKAKWAGVEAERQRRQEEWRRDARERTARNRAAQVLADQDPERFEEIVAGERVLAALDWD